MAASTAQLPYHGAHAQARDNGVHGERQLDLKSICVSVMPQPRAASLISGFTPISPLYVFLSMGNMAYMVSAVYMVSGTMRVI
jgi:hypothetical protein